MSLVQLLKIIASIRIEYWFGGTTAGALGIVLFALWARDPLPLLPIKILATFWALSWGMVVWKLLRED